MFKSEEEARKYIKKYLGQLACEEDISDSQIKALEPMLEMLSDQKRKAIVQRAAAIDARFSELYCGSEGASEQIAQADGGVVSRKNRFSDLAVNVQDAHPRKKIQQTRGSQNSAIAMQNTLLSLMIDGYTSENNNKRFFNYIYSNGNRGVLFNNVVARTVEEPFCELLKPHQIGALVVNQRVRAAKVQDGAVAQDQVVLGDVVGPVVKGPKEQQEKHQDGFIPTQIAANFFKHVLRPQRVRNRQRIADFCLTPDDFGTYGYNYVVSDVPRPEKPPRVFSLDCEMVQTGSTNKDLSLARLTVLDASGAIVMDEFCAPELQVVDYLTPFSGITKEMLCGAQSQDELIRKYRGLVCRDGAEPMIIGHGLDNDFNVMGVEHRLVFDTSVFLSSGQHRKFKLQYLAQQFLDREIQHGSGGHDSAEDALAALEIAYGCFYAFGSEEIQEEYAKYKEVGERIIKYFKSGGEELFQRLSDAVQRCWYQINVFCAKELAQGGMVKALDAGFEAGIGEGAITFEKRCLIVSEEEVDEFRVADYVDRCTRLLPRNFVVITVLTTPGAGSSLAISFVIE